MKVTTSLLSCFVSLAVAGLPAATEALPPPENYAFLLLPGFELLDVFAPLDTLQYLAHHHHLNLHLLARTLAPVTTRPPLPNSNPHNSSFWPALTPTATFADALADKSEIDIDVLVVPGGVGVRASAADLAAEIGFIRAVFPRLRYLVTICTGSSLAARAGVLDGRRATTNKAAWGEVTPLGPNVKW